MLLIALVLLCAITYILKPVFLSERNIMNTLRQVSLTAICGFGLTLIILVGEIDLSVGSQQAVAGVLSVVVLNATGSVLLAILAALAGGLVVGGLNGLIITKFKINSMCPEIPTPPTSDGSICAWDTASRTVRQSTRYHSNGSCSA